MRTIAALMLLGGVAMAEEKIADLDYAKYQLAATQVSNLELMLEKKTAEKDRLAAELKEKYHLGAGDIVDAMTHAIKRASPSPVAAVKAAKKK